MQLTGRVSLSGGSSQSIQFFGKMHGFVTVGYPLELHRTADGGTNWVVVGLPISDAGSVTFSDSRHGWLLGRYSRDQVPHLYSTGDSGDSWQRLPDPPFDSIGMTFRSPSEGWMWTVGAARAHVYDSDDGGRSWLRHNLAEPPAGLPSGSTLATRVRLLPVAGVALVAIFASDGNGSPYELTSFDRGTSWKYVPPRSTQAFAGAESFEDALHWWVIEQGSLYKSSDAGQTWTTVPGHLERGPYWQYFSYIIDSMHAWAQVATGEGTGLAVTNDGGLHWTRVPVPQTA